MCANFTLRSQIPHPGEVDQEFKSLTAPQYLMNRAAYWQSKGNPLLSIDGISGEEITFTDFLEWSNGVASWFWKHGLKRGEVVLYLIDNFTKLPPFFTGVWRANGLLRACYPEELQDTIRERVEESHCKFIYCEQDKAQICLRVANSITDWEIRVIVNDVTTTIPGCTPLSQLFSYKGEVPKLEITPQDGALILCTSGTTGRCKGALRNHRSLVNLIKSEEMYPWGPRSMLVCKGTHISGSCFPLGNLALGICSIIVWKPEPRTIFRAVSRYKPTVLFAFPGYLLWLADEERERDEFHSLQKLFTAGVVLDPAIKEKLLTLPNVEQVLNIYGMTESSHFLSNCEKLDSTHFRGIDVPGNVVGKPAPGGQIQIREPNTGNPLGPCQQGEIHVKHVDMFSEYINSPNETKEAFTADGWFKTGDIGFYDQNQFVTIVGRRKEIFKYFNNHISPNHIDQVVKEHPGVKEACTIGVTHHDGFNSVPRVFVTLKQGHEGTPEEITSFANERLPDHMQLRGGVFVVHEMPKGNTGKVTREAVARLYAQA